MSLTGEDVKKVPESDIPLSRDAVMQVIESGEKVALKAMEQMRRGYNTLKRYEEARSVEGYMNVIKGGIIARALVKKAKLESIKGIKPHESARKMSNGCAL